MHWIANPAVQVRFLSWSPITDIVRRESVLHANGLKIATYRVRDMETLEFGALQIHVTYENCVVAVLSETMLQCINSLVNPKKAEPNV